MTRKFYTLVAAFLLVLPGSAFAQTMWQNVDRGMSPQQVQQLQPDAVIVAKPDHLYDGSECRLRIESYRVGSNDYKVCFFFKADRVTQVTLGFKGEPTKSNFDDIVLLLTAKYGKPDSLKQDSIGWDADWLLPNGVNIALTFIGKPLTPLININFQYRIAQESSKL